MNNNKKAQRNEDHYFLHLWDGTYLSFIFVNATDGIPSRFQYLIKFFSSFSRGDFALKVVPEMFELIITPEKTSLDFNVTKDGH